MKAPIDPWERTSETTIALSGSSVRIVHPMNADDLISEADYVKDERLPYWADIWPSSRILAEELLLEVDANGKSLLELGCGVGLVSLAAVQAGFSVLASDYYEPALEFTARNVANNTSGSVRTLHWSWRDPFPLPESFDVVAASDILYESEYVTLIADILIQLLRPGGSAIFADPGRVLARDFLTRCTGLGLRLFSHKRIRITDAGRKQTIDIYRFRRDAA